MSRKPQTCSDCARRKIKCNKIIPCGNCTKRGTAHLCRRAEVTQSVERPSHRPSESLSPSTFDLASPTLPKPPIHELPINERILSLVTSLSERVKQVESKLDRLEPRKRAPEHTGHPVEDTGYPAKKTRLSRTEDALSGPRLQDGGEGPGDDPAHNGSDVEAEDAATVLEFLAWGRIKDSQLTSGIRDSTSAHDTAVFPEKDINQTMQPWSLSPGSISGGHMPMETLQISQIQDMLPTKIQAFLLFEYHADWLLFMHCSFHVQTFRRELDQFYNNDHGIISVTSSALQWTALLFSIICSSMTCAKPTQIITWGFLREDQSSLAQQWFQASLECLNTARYQQNHSLYGVQTISSSTICAHILGFSSSQSVLLAAAVRIAQSLGLHRLGRTKRSESEDESLTEATQREVGRRLWQQLTTQDWLSLPFSETYCVNPLHSSTLPPLHCDEDTMEPISLSKATVMSYGNFLSKISFLMPALHDRSLEAHSLEAKYNEVLRFDKMMRELVISHLPSCLNSQTPIDPSWPKWVLLSRRCLTITSAHKVIMIHRRFLGLSFHDKRFALTRRTCLAAAKTIINETKQELPDESPILWTTQAFSVAAAIILSLDNFNRHRSGREYGEHRQLISETVGILSKSVSISSIAARGTRLLTELLAEEQNHSLNADISQPSQNGKQKVKDGSSDPRPGENSLNVAAFVKKFCDSEFQPGNSPTATSHMPLWLQQDTTYASYSDNRRRSEDAFPATQSNDSYRAYQLRVAQPISSSTYDMLDPRYEDPPARCQYDGPANPFTQHLSENFDIRSANWFNDLLGLAPSHSI